VNIIVIFNLWTNELGWSTVHVDGSVAWNRFNYVLLSLFGTSKSTKPIFTSWFRLHVKTPAHPRSLTFFNRVSFIHSCILQCMFMAQLHWTNVITYSWVCSVHSFFYKNIVFPVGAEFLVFLPILGWNIIGNIIRFIIKWMRALWLVNQIWFIASVNSWKFRVSSELLLK